MALTKTSSVVLAVIVVLGAAWGGVVACAETPPSPDTADAIHFGTASRPTYLSVDGRTTLLFNPLMNIVSVQTAPDAQGPGKDLDESCKMPGIACVTLLGVSLSEPPHMGNSMAPDWKARGARFQIVGCVREYQGKCVTHLISTLNGSGIQGWYTHSLKRGVELFARKGAGPGYEEVFVLTAESGLLKAGTN